MVTTTRPASSRRWIAALARARAEGITLYKDRDRYAYHALSADGLRLYPVSLQGCACKAGQSGNVCKHQAALRAHFGLLGATPEPEPPAPAVAASAPQRRCTSCLDTGWARLSRSGRLDDYTDVPCGCGAGQVAHRAA